MQAFSTNKKDSPKKSGLYGIANPFTDESNIRQDGLFQHTKLTSSIRESSDCDLDPFATEFRRIQNDIGKYIGQPTGFKNSKKDLPEEKEKPQDCNSLSPPIYLNPPPVSPGADILLEAEQVSSG